MKRCLLLVFIYLFVSQSFNDKIYAQVKPHSIFLATPESDTSVTYSSRIGFSAGTTPGSMVTVNGKEYKLYPSGAFADWFSLNPGENSYTITSVSPKGEKAEKSFVVIRKMPLGTTSRDTLVIEDAMMQPSNEQWLDEGDLLIVQFKGTPGCVASFEAGKWINMRELPVNETKGLGGVYQAAIKVKAGDRLDAQTIKFKLTDLQGRTVTKESKAMVSIIPDEFPRIGVTKGDRPYLNFGLGGDRLGGAKMSFLNPDIKVKITGKSGNQYRVALGNDLYAWIPDDQVDLLPLGSILTTQITGSWSVYGDDKFDYVNIGIGEKLPYKTEQDPERNRIMVYVYGAVSNSNWITQLNTTKEIKNVYYEQSASDVFKVIIDLKHKQNWGYGVSYNGNSISIKIRRQPKSLDIEDLKIALDAGHGGEGFGARGATGSEEKQINLSTVYHLKEILEKKGAEVILTRKDDIAVPNSKRLKEVIDSEADILISIHSNATAETSDPVKVSGTSTYYKYICFRPLSTYIYNEVLKTGLEPFGNVGSFNFTLNSATELPSVLVELAFMSNPTDEMKLMDDDFRKELAKRIVKGLEKYLESCED